jgi:hypothetical protein
MSNTAWTILAVGAVILLYLSQQQQQLANVNTELLALEGKGSAAVQDAAYGTLSTPNNPNPNGASNVLSLALDVL